MAYFFVMFLIFGLAFAAVMTSANQAAHASDPSFYGKELSRYDGNFMARISRLHC